MLRELLGDCKDGAQVRLAVVGGGRAHGDEGQVYIPNGGREVRREHEATRAGVLPYHLLKARFVDGNLVALEALDFVRVRVDANDSLTGRGEACAGDEAYVTCTNDAQFHSDAIA